MNGLKAARERICLKQADPLSAKLLAKELNVPLSVATILVGRNLTTFNSCKNFFRPQISHFHDPFLFKQMEKAVDRIMEAIKTREKIVVYGDYDVDGVTSTVLLVRVLRLLEANCDYYLPNRLVDGYGITENSVRHIAEKGAKLIITVDCGITALKEIHLASILGVDCIITDHHEPKEKLPSAVAVIDQKLPECNYPDKNLAGVGVTLKLAQALGEKSGRGEQLWMPFLDLASLGTAADIVPLIGENRVIASLGFDQLSKTTNIGLKALISAQNLEGKRISTGEVVFQIAPCINAVGRLGDPRRGVELLLTDDPSIAKNYACELREANRERRALDTKVAQEASLWVENNCRSDKDFVIVVGHPEWHVGVIGIVASKMVERFHRPAILLSMGPDGVARGSGRSIPGLHLLDALSGCSDILTSFGGHAAAAGLSVQWDRIEQFREKFNSVVQEKLTEDDLIRKVQADTEVSVASLTPKLFRIMKQMGPFGPGNMRPVLLCKDLKHRYAPRVVGQNHLKMSLTDSGVVMDAIGFNLGERISEVCNSSSLQVAFTLEENKWNGKTNLQMNIKGISV
ncbi:single-stranded-DNA-specific exonuclease RecJ [Chitinispirillales bacterium ANBcel5]|uniref:single-stranded-DNA-specific exonuclease RecJ n=1 Tax=Cellulosispirillum alkaliphilum TaxID=3039283 RepID=UPI002A56E9DF|nr:single-stranded-DNA-specific exonuclease RecJ [Chitinispirillales bacterium ANBcel5]